MAYRVLGLDKASRHEAVYAGVRSSIPEESYILLTQGDPFRAEVAASPEAFSQQLPFYHTKPLYPLLVAGTMRLGVEPVAATLWVSRVGYIAIALVLYYWLLTYLSPVRSAVTAVLFAALPFVLDLARLSTPDSVSTALVLLGLAWMAKGHRSRGQTMLAFSILARPDNILWLVATTGHSALWAREHFKRDLAVLAGTTLVTAVMLQVMGAYSWGVLTHHTFFGQLAYPADFDPKFSAWQLIRLYLRASHPAHIPSFALLSLMLVGGVALIQPPERRWRDATGRLMAIAIGYMAMHWLVLPHGQRFFVPAYLCIGVAIFLWGRDVAALQKRATAA